MWGWSDAPDSCRSESMTVQITLVAELGGGLYINGYWQYRNMSETTFSHFGDVLLITRYVGPDLKRYTEW